jgi:hypothetical protein
MRRLIFVPAAAIMVLVFAGAVHSRKFPACPAGRFIVAPGDAPLLLGSPSLDAVTIAGGPQIVLASCGAARAKIHGTKSFTSVAARWPHCGSFTKVRLKGRIPSPACDTLQGTIRAKKTPVKSFAATLSTCGDGFLDSAVGESCDSTASGGDAACPGRCNPAGTPDACTCAPPTTTTITTTLSTTTTTVSPTCGNGTVDSGETCDDGNTVDDNTPGVQNDNCPSNCFILACTPVQGTSRTVSVKFTPPAGQTVGGLAVFVDYPEGQVGVPTIHLSSGVSGVVHDQDYGLTEELLDANGTGLPASPNALFQITFEDCQGAPPPTAADFRCTVKDASDENGAVLDPTTMSCVVTIP